MQKREKLYILKQKDSTLYPSTKRMILFLKDPVYQREVIDVITNRLNLTPVDPKLKTLMTRAHFLVKLQDTYASTAVVEIYYVKQGIYYYITYNAGFANGYTHDEVQTFTHEGHEALYYRVKWEDLIKVLQFHPVYGEDCQIPSDLIEEVHPGNTITSMPESPTINPSLEVGNSYIVQANSIAINGNTLFTQVKKETTMEKIMNQNVTAAKTVANLTAGKVINKKLIKELSKMLPKSAKGVLKHPIAEIVLANAVAVAIDKFAPGNKKAAYVKEACLTAAYANTEAFLGIESLISGLLDQVTLPDFTDED